MKKPIRRKGGPPGGGVSVAYNIPAPTGGWFVGANMAVAPVGTARELINVFPLPDSLRIRRGAQAHATGLGGDVHTLIRFADGVNEKFFAAANGSIFDVTDAGAVGSALVTGLSANRMEYVQFANSGATWIIAVNGANPAQLYSFAGGWVTSPAITGMANPASHVSTYKNRLYLTEVNSLNVWYLAVNAIGGAATSFPTQGVFRLGGAVLCTASWSVTSAAGIQEAFVILTTEGEVAIYSGPDPSSASWGLVGLYKIPRPLGVRSVAKAGGDLMILTEEGIVSLSKAMTLDQIAMQNVAITKNIAPVWIEAVLARQGLTGWQLVLWPSEGMGFVNLPKRDAGDKTQFVVNARTGAWCKYTGWDALCFREFDNKLFYGTSDGRVMRAEVGGADDGGNYTATIFPSFSDGGAKATRKLVHMVRPYFTSNFVIDPQVTVNVDFDTLLPPTPSSVAPSLEGARWGVARWGQGRWPREVRHYSEWKAAQGIGVYVSPIIQVTLSTAAITPEIRLTAIDVMGEAGNVL